MNYSQSSFLSRLTKLVNKGQERSVKAKKNIISGVFIKGGSIVVSLLMVPLTIGYVDTTGYGIWLTISSIIAWFNFFDVGLTQGLRNKFAEALALEQYDLAQTYVSTTYALLTLIFSGVWLLLLIANQFIDWATIVNAPAGMRDEINLLAFIVFTYFCLRFVLRVITTILIADQQPSRSSLIDLMGQIISLAFVVILVNTTHGSLVYLGIALCLSPILVLVATSIFFFRKGYARYRPNLSKVDFSKAGELFNLGIKFFVIQVANVIQYQTANVLIANNFGPGEVTSYNIVYKYFGLLNMAFVIFLTPFWSASTEAYLKGDIHWIKRAMKKYNHLGLLLFAGGLVMLFLASDIYRLWLGEGTVDIPFALSMWGLIYFTAALFATKYVFFLNSISALRIQFYTSMITPLIFIAVTILFIKHYQMGVYAIFIASLIGGFNGIVIAPIQYYQVIHRSKKGIWIK
ncbi:MAG: MATE family efflux transporter [Saprospiraceae bacterium]